MFTYEKLNVEPTLTTDESFNRDPIFSNILWQNANPIPISSLDSITSLSLFIGILSAFVFWNNSKMFILFFFLIPHPESETAKFRVQFWSLSRLLNRLLCWYSQSTITVTYPRSVYFSALNIKLMSTCFTLFLIKMHDFRNTVSNINRKTQ